MSMSITTTYQSKTAESELAVSLGHKETRVRQLPEVTSFQKALQSIAFWFENTSIDDYAPWL
jgi:hypothetical protein